MIEDARPTDWHTLQSGVCTLLNEVGLIAEIEKKVQTPRGEVEIDVYAVDENSVDRIKYVVECKNWGTPVPQSVVHSFTTVMHEIGGNIGYIVSREGFQSGAEAYLKNTNIVGLTYLDLQVRYFERWWSRYFIPKVGSGADSLLQYVEPINSRRERFLHQLPPERQELVRTLRKKHERFGLNVAFVGFSPTAKRLAADPSSAVANFKDQLVEAGVTYPFSSVYFRDLADEIVAKAREVTAEFNSAFGQDIFTE